MSCPLARVFVTAVLLTCVVAIPETASAQLPYTFTKITDTTVTPGVAGVSCVGINDRGTVVVRLNDNKIYTGRDSASFALLASGTISLCPSINDSDEVSYTTPGSSPGIQLLVKNAGGTLTTLASSTGSPALYTPTTVFPALNNAGHAVYVANGNGAIAIAPAGTIVATNPPINFVSPASMNDSGVVAFAGMNGAGTAGIYRGSATPLLQSGDSISGGTIVFSSLQRPVINGAGVIAFIGRLDFGSPGVHGVYLTDGASVALATSTPSDRYSLNDSGSVLIRKTLSGGAGTGLYLGRPGLLDQEVIGQGDVLDGSTVQEAFVWEESLNDLGQAAFWAQLADGRRGIYVATPKWLNSLSFSNNRPACGPLAAKVTLTTIAPPGGLTVALESFNAAGAVPASVFIAAGKKTGAFQITPTPVTSNTVGNIEATYGAQTLVKSLKIRPITVKSVSLAPNPVIGGGGVLGTVLLDCGAQPAALTVALSSTKPAIAAVAVPSIVVPQGVSSATFNVTTSPVVASTTATIKASAKGVTKSKALVVNP